MPSDSQFAIAMKNQQEAERAEQQRIKNLVLNYDLQDFSAEPGTGSTDLLYDPFSHPNPNFRAPPPLRTFSLMVSRDVDKIKHAHATAFEGTSAGEKHQHNASLHQSSPHHATNARPMDKSSSNRSGHRARKLQLSDVDWYDGTEIIHSHFLASSPFPDRGRGSDRPCGPSHGRFRNGRESFG